MIIVLKHFVPKGFIGITLFPFIIVSNRKYLYDTACLNHEKIHLQQQLELGIIFFYIWYGIEWTIKYISYRNAQEAYHQLSFEREAYQQENNTNYLKSRKYWAFLNYL